MAEAGYRERTLSGVLRRAVRSFPAIVVTGPRQSGKTTLIRHEFGNTHSYTSLDDPTVREQALRDPALLLERFPPPVILDEIQQAPEILPFLKASVDAHRSHAARFVLTGSQLFPLMRGGPNPSRDGRRSARCCPFPFAKPKGRPTRTWTGVTHCVAARRRPRCCPRARGSNDSGAAGMPSRH